MRSNIPRSFKMSFISVFNIPNKDNYEMNYYVESNEFAMPGTRSRLGRRSFRELAV